MQWRKTAFFEPLPDTDLDAITTQIFGDEVQLIERRLIEGGLFNTSYFIETRNPDQKIVVRVAPSRMDLLVEFEKTMMAAEPGINDHMRAVGVPVPQVVHLDLSRKVIAREYIAMEFIDAKAMSTVEIPEEDRPALNRQLGTYTRKIHSVRGDRFGWPTPDGGIRGGDCWEEVFGSFVEELCRRSRDYHVLPEGDIETIERLWHSQSSIFRECKDPRLVHNDLWEPNLLVRHGDTGWEIAAVIDGDRAMFADPEYEFVLWGQDPDIMAGYGSDLDPSKNAVQRRKWYALGLSLINAYVWEVEYEDRDEADRSIQRVAESIRDL
jgi:aminoglycoside phosphotransferase (APT) family kinase protein